MSQQLNLLPAEKLAISPGLLALLFLAAVICGVMALWGVNQFRLRAIEEKVAVAEADLRQTRAALQQRIDAKAALLARIEATRPLAAAAVELLKMTNELGNTTGFASQFTTLADATEDGLWLTRVDLAKSKVTQVDGQSLNSDAVLRFTRNLNTLFASQNMQFTTVELTPQTLAPAAGRPPLGSTKFVIR